jgi:tetratricopeptide (TPR) repeat protein
VEYSARDVAKLLNVSVRKVRGYVEAGFLAPARGPRGELRFSFQDLVLLRTASGLLAADVPSRRVKRALRQLRAQLPDGQPLTGVHIAAEGNRIVVRDGRAVWQPESGQALFDFGVAELERRVASLTDGARRPQRAEPELSAPTADDWYEHGCALELDDPAGAIEAYRRAVAIDPAHAESHVNLGRLHHEAGDFAAAETHYRGALAARPADAIAAYNLGVVLEDSERLEAAVAAYEQALASDGKMADAHYNLARLQERLGQQAAAIRHLKAYRKLTQ